MTDWKPIPGWNGEYEASDDGQVRSWLNGRWGLADTPRVLKQRAASGTGYMVVALRQRKHGVHRLVALAHIGPPPRADMEVAHLNGRRSDNRVSNLMWATRKENAGHRLLHGTDLRGAKHPSAKITEAQASEIRRRWAAGESSPVLGREFGMSRGNIMRIVRGKSWLPVAA